jgi:hypothetical protein
MKNLTRYSMLLSVLTLLSIQAAAQEAPFSVSVGIGSSSFQLNEAGIVASYGAPLTSSSTFDDSATAFSLYGAMRLDEYLTLETDLLIAGDVTVTEGGQTFKLFDVSSFAVSLALGRRVGERSRLFARLGAHFWDISESSGDLNTINNAVDLTYGVGVDVNLYGDRSQQLRIQWNHYEYDGVFIDESDTLSANLLFLIGGE